MILTFFRKPLGVLIAALIVLGLLWWGYRALTADSRTEARLAKNQAEAALESGRDAVNTVGEANERETASEDLTRDNERTIRDAEGADANVGDPANNAGLDALCRRAAYRNTQRCLDRVRQ